MLRTYIHERTEHTHTHTNVHISLFRQTIEILSIKPHTGWNIPNLTYHFIYIRTYNLYRYVRIISSHYVYSQ